jgi:hypothetical protein
VQPTLHTQFLTGPSVPGLPSTGYQHVGDPRPRIGTSAFSAACSAIPYPWIVLLALYTKARTEVLSSSRTV